MAGRIFYNLLALCFYALFYCRYKIIVSGLDNYTAAPSTLIIVSHKSDMDVPITSSTFHLRKTLPGRLPYLNYIAREDLLQPGFLTGRFDFFQRLGFVFKHVDITPIMKSLHCYPIDHLIHNRIGYLVRTLLASKGNLMLVQAFTPAGLQRIASLGGRKFSNLDSMCLEDLLDERFTRLLQIKTDTDILRSELAVIIRLETLKRIQLQLRNIVDVIEEGGSFLLFPEGQISDDGQFQNIKSGLHRIISMTGADVRLLPVNVTYDYMTRGRMRIFFNIGREITGIMRMTRSELENTARRAILLSGQVTMGQLGSLFLLARIKHGAGTFDKDDFKVIVARQKTELQAAGLRLDAVLLNRPGFEYRAEAFLGYCLKHKLISQDGYSKRYRINTACVSGHGSALHGKPLEHSTNELKGILELYPALMKEYCS